MSLRLCNNANSSLKVNESLSTGGEYILEGVFAELGVMNVNRRIYTEEEYLKHLGYIREDASKGDLLGELDHPDERFEVKMEGVSHQIIDVWYDQPNKMVMGKIKLLNTPKGQIAKAVVDAGIPLHISSRAAGTINKDNTVSIQQIYTYDIVAKPGFAKATLHRVNESATPLSDDVKSFLERSELLENENISNKYGILSEGVVVNDMSASVNLRKEAIEINEGKSNTIDMEKLTKHILNEDEDQSKESALGMATPSMDPVKEADGDEEENKNTEDPKPDDEKKEDGDGEKEEKKESELPYEIVSAEVVSSESDEKDDEKKEDDEKTEDDEKKEEDEKEDTKEEDKEEDEKTEETSECGDSDAKKKNAVFDAKTKSEDAVKKADAGLSKLDEIIEQLKKKKQVNDGVKESLRQEYPFTTFLNESDLIQFSGLADEQKSRVKKYLLENNVVTIDGVQRLWRNGLNENAQAEPVWLRYASHEYRKLYESASDVEKQNLEETAQFIIFENQHDVDVFWERSGLKTKRERQLLKESFLQNAPKVNEQAQRVYNELPYTKESLQVYLNMVD